MRIKFLYEYRSYVCHAKYLLSSLMESHALHSCHDVAQFIGYLHIVGADASAVLDQLCLGDYSLGFRRTDESGIAVKSHNSGLLPV